MAVSNDRPVESFHDDAALPDDNRPKVMAKSPEILQKLEANERKQAQIDRKIQELHTPIHYELVFTLAAPKVKPSIAQRIQSLVAKVADLVLTRLGFKAIPMRELCGEIRRVQSTAKDKRPCCIINQ